MVDLNTLISCYAFLFKWLPTEVIFVKFKLMVIFNLIWIQQKPKNNFSLTILNDFGELTFRYDCNVFFDEIKLPLVESDDVREMILR
jgi:hypothetical protein